MNLQLGTFSLNSSRLEGVDERIVRFPEFAAMFGEEGMLAQCATIKCSTRRLWVCMHACVCVCACLHTYTYACT